MGLLVDGKWHDKWYDTDSTDGRFERSESQFRNWIRKDPDSEFPAARDRYHLYVSYACPWAHRTLIFRELKGLGDIIPVSAVQPLMLENGWEFGEAPLNDPLYDAKFLYELYLRADDNYSGRVTVPILWDKQQQTIVSNESADIIRMFNNEFDHLTGNTLNFYPEARQSAIDSINEQVYHTINNGVYKCGFATTQDAYEEAYEALFNSLDDIEAILAKQRFLVGDEVTEADWRLFTTLMRFDAVYYSHFKTNQRRITDYPHLWDYLKALYQVNGVADTVVMEHIKKHYYGSHTMINPTGIVPVGPAINFDEPHQRGEVL